MRGVPNDCGVAFDRVVFLPGRSANDCDGVASLKLGHDGLYVNQGIPYAVQV